MCVNVCVCVKKKFTLAKSGMNCTSVHQRQAKFIYESPAHIQDFLLTCILSALKSNLRCKPLEIHGLARTKSELQEARTACNMAKANLEPQTQRWISILYSIMGTANTFC